MKPIWDAEKAEKAAKLNRENMLVLAKECGVTVIIFTYVIFFKRDNSWLYFILY